VKEVANSESFFQFEELRSLRGTLGLPGTVAPFRAWRGSRDLVARSPKFHVSAVVEVRDCKQKSNTGARPAPLIEGRYERVGVKGKRRCLAVLGMTGFWGRVEKQAEEMWEHEAQPLQLRVDKAATLRQVETAVLLN